MKRFRWYFLNVLLTILVSLPNVADAQNSHPISTTDLPLNDSVMISLLTCGPGNQVYSLYGHTAIRYRNKMTNEDYVINYGIFSFHQKHFVLRFIFGLTDYQMGIIPYPNFIDEYLYEGRWVKEQILNISPTDKHGIALAIHHNYLPENRVYRYNYFYDNCTTRARNILLNNLSCKVYPIGNQLLNTSFREEIYKWNQNHLWARWGNDLLLGMKADRRISYKENEFLPNQLSKDFDRAFFYCKDGQKHKLIKYSHWLIEPTESPNTSTSSSWLMDNPIYPIGVFCLVAFFLTIYEYKKRTYSWAGKIYDNLSWLITGAAGLILTAMIFSQHPTVSLNLQILILNPLHIGLLVPPFRRNRRFQICISLCLLCGILGAFLQHYASGVLLLAFVLSFRAIHVFTINRKELNT